MPGYKNLSHKQEMSAQKKGGITRAHLNVINSGEHEEGMKALKKKHAGDKEAQKHIKNLDKMHAEAWEP